MASAHEHKALARQHEFRNALCVKFGHFHQQSPLFIFRRLFACCWVLCELGRLGLLCCQVGYPSVVFLGALKSTTRPRVEALCREALGADFDAAHGDGYDAETLLRVENMLLPLGFGVF